MLIIKLPVDRMRWQYLGTIRGTSVSGSVPNWVLTFLQNEVLAGDDKFLEQLLQLEGRKCPYVILKGNQFWYLIEGGEYGPEWGEDKLEVYKAKRR